MKRLGLAIVLGGALSAVGGGVHAAEPRYSRTFDRCMDAAAGVTFEMHDCLTAEIGRWDASLNATYRQRMASLSPSAQVQLREDERAWIKRRDAKCDRAGDDNAGGSLQVIEINDCYLAETYKRVTYLRER